MIPFPDKKYQIIYADPPWSYRNKKTGGSMQSGAAQKYDVMTLSELSLLPIREISAKDSVLFMWCTTPMQYEGWTIMQSWGFTYKTKIYWRKIMSLGMGYWFRGQVEELWVGTKGKIKAFRLQEANFIQAKVLRHSEKPEIFRELIERATSNMILRNKIELFARRRVEGWDVWGNEV